MSLTASHILGCRPSIAEPIEHTIRTKYAAGWNTEDIADYLTQMNPNITAVRMRDTASRFELWADLSGANTEGEAA